MKKYYPEGSLLSSKQNIKAMTSIFALKDSFYEGKILESKAVMCDKEHNLYVDLGGIKGIIPRNECAMGITEGTVRDIAIISRVGKTVCFKITEFKTDEDGNEYALLSRKAVQEECEKEYLNNLKAGDVIDAKVTHNEQFGSFCDIGCGISALLPIDSISVSRIPHPNVRFRIGDLIKAIVKETDEQGRIVLTHKELLGTWEENAENFSPGQTVEGVVRSIEQYGIFVELAPNLAGLSEYLPGIKEGDMAGVYIKSINPEKMKIKLAIVDSYPADNYIKSQKYYFHGDHMNYWKYSPSTSKKVIESEFNS